MIGRIERVPLREVWKDEARDFTPWLRENIEVLGEELGIGLSEAVSEQAAGNFSVDIVAKDANGNMVIIENQLEKSNHDHLGKLITYLTAIEAKTAIWIVKDPQSEHVKAITWLNESDLADFYLLKLEAIQIDTSSPAPLLTLIVGPSEEARKANDMIQDWAEKDRMRYRFWKQHLERANERTQLHANISPSKGDWITASAGKSGLALGYVVLLDRCSIELYIDRGKGAEARNKAIFDQLHARKDEIEQACGDLHWQRLDDKRACRISIRLDIGGWKDEDKWPDMQDAMIDAMIRFEEALRPHIDALKI